VISISTDTARTDHFGLLGNQRAVTPRLYDLARDPWERHNLLTEPSQEILDIANELRKELESWAATADPLPSQFDPSQTQETMDRLRALGYFE